MLQIKMTNSSKTEMLTNESTKTMTSNKEKVNSILANLDGNSEFTIDDIIVLGNIEKKDRAVKLGLDPNNYEVRVDSKAGIVNIIEKVKNSIWLNFDINKINSQNEATTTNNNTTWVMPTKVDDETMKLFDTDSNGKFTYTDNVLRIGESVYNLTNWNLGNSWEASVSNASNQLKMLNGQKLTPDLINKIVNIILDMGNEGIQGATACGEMGQPIPFIEMIKLNNYLKPSTVDNLLNNMNFYTYYGDEETADTDELKLIKEFYNRLDTKQQDKYYENMLSTRAHVTGNYFEEWQKNGNSMSELIFETPVSNKNFNRLKNLVADLNKKGNGIKATKTQSQLLIETLLEKGQITKQQAEELYKAATIK